jgi:hypothetical protein
MRHFILSAAALAFLLAGSQAVSANEKKEIAFGALEAVAIDAAKARAADWLKEAGKNDPATLQRFETIWKQEDRTVLDRLADTFALANADAANLLAEARNPLSLAPTKVPDLLKDAKQPLFFRANLALAYGRNLSNRRVHEEALEIFKLFRPEQVIDPSAYLFHRAVCEHALLQKAEADKTISRLLRDSIGTPERYKTVSMLMLLDMQTWKDKDLGAIARKMENIERRLELARGGPQTQKLQKEVVLRLDELIKELENQAKKKGGDGSGKPNPNDGGCPDGGQPGSPSSGPPKGNDPSSPATESGIANQGGTGKVDPAKMRKLVERWGILPPREQAKALQELTQGMSPRHREAIENYFRNIAQAQRRN